SGALPATLTATWSGERWAWSDGDANKTVCIEGALKNQCGTDAMSWVREHGATELVVTVETQADRVHEDAGVDGRGVEGHGTGASHAEANGETPIIDVAEGRDAIGRAGGGEPERPRRRRTR